MAPFLAPHADRIYGVMRVVVGFLFMLHGAQKVLGLIGGIDGAGGTPELFSRLGAAGVIELFGGALIAVGLFTRAAAFVASGEMAVAYFTAHQPNAFWPLQNQGERAVLYCFAFLYMAARGSGCYSLDAVLGKRRHWLVRTKGTPERSGFTNWVLQGRRVGDVAPTALG